MRLVHYESSLSGRQQEAVQEAQALNHEAEQQIRAVLNDVRGAIAYVVAAGDRRPNRIDECRKTTPSGSDVFARPGNVSGVSSSSPPSRIGGQPRLADLPTSQASNLPRTAQNPFASAPGQSSPFGRTSALGATAQVGNPFANTRAAQVANSSRTPTVLQSQQSPVGKTGQKPRAWLTARCLFKKANSTTSPLNLFPAKRQSPGSQVCPQDQTCISLQFAKLE